MLKHHKLTHAHTRTNANPHTHSHTCSRRIQSYTYRKRTSCYRKNLHTISNFLLIVLFLNSLLSEIQNSYFAIFSFHLITRVVLYIFRVNHFPCEIALWFTTHRPISQKLFTLLVNWYQGEWDIEEKKISSLYSQTLINGEYSLLKPRNDDEKDANISYAN